MFGLPSYRLPGSWLGEQVGGGFLVLGECLGQPQMCTRSIRPRE